jgi:hypothetical protein
MSDHSMSDIESRHRESNWLTSAYMYDPDFIEGRYQAPPLIDLLRAREVHGVSRFIEKPSFAPERIHTLVYSRATVIVSSIVGATSLWRLIPQFGYLNGSKKLSEIPGCEPFEPSRAVRRQATLELSASSIPPVLASWETLKRAALGAASCWTPTLDGITYNHRARDADGGSHAQWSNPCQTEHPQQVSLIAAYETLLRLTNMSAVDHAGEEASEPNPTPDRGR